MLAADRTAQLDAWMRRAEDDPQGALEDRLTRAALAAVAMEDPDNQDAVIARLPRRGLDPERFAAMQAIICDTRRDEDLRRFALERLLGAPREDWE